MTIRKLRKGTDPTKYKFEFPITQVVPRTNTEKLIFKYIVRVLGYQINIAKKFVHNGASIPRFLWSIIGCPFSPRFRAAAIVHDYLYFIKANRKLADQIFKQMLLDAGVSRVKAAAMYRGVRLFGGRAWKKGQKPTQEVKEG